MGLILMATPGVGFNFVIAAVLVSLAAATPGWLYHYVDGIPESIFNAVRFILIIIVLISIIITIIFILIIPVLYFISIITFVFIPIISIVF